MKLVDLRPGDIYVSHQSATPRYALILDISHTYRAPDQKNDFFRITTDKKSHSHGRGALCLASRSPECLELCAQRFDRHYLIGAATHWPRIMNDVIMTEMTQELHSKARKTSFAVIAPRFLHPIS